MFNGVPIVLPTEEELVKRIKPVLSDLFPGFSGTCAIGLANRTLSPEDIIQEILAIVAKFLNGISAEEEERRDLFERVRKIAIVVAGTSFEETINQICEKMGLS
jgi:hypothetical protein